MRIHASQSKPTTLAGRVTFVGVSLWYCFLLLLVTGKIAAADKKPFPNNAPRCEQCHGMPSKYGSSPLTVQRVGNSVDGRFVPGVEGGILHRNGASGAYAENALSVERVSLNLLGDGYIEAVADKDIERNLEDQQRTNLRLKGQIVSAPVLESAGAPKFAKRPGRFGWKSQHGSLMSACADSLRNELGIRNRLYDNEYSNHNIADGPTPFDIPDPATGRTELQRLVEEIRQMPPPERDRRLSKQKNAQAGERLFAQIGCAICHVSIYKTLPAGTLINDDTYSVPNAIGGKTIYPYSDFLLHDIGTGDAVPEAAKPEFLDQSTAMKFRTPPLWGLRFRSWMMHDGKSTTSGDAISRHAGEASDARKRYDMLTPLQQKCLQSFLSSL